MSLSLFYALFLCECKLEIDDNFIRDEYCFICRIVFCVVCLFHRTLVFRFIDKLHGRNKNIFYGSKWSKNFFLPILQSNSLYSFGARSFALTHSLTHTIGHWKWNARSKCGSTRLIFYIKRLRWTGHFTFCIKLTVRLPFW